MVLSQIRRHTVCPYKTDTLFYLFQAILGTTQKVRTVDGEVDLKIPAGVQPGATLLMAKRGVPKLGQPNTRGDQYVTVKVTIPKQVGGREKELVEELERM